MVLRPYFSKCGLPFTKRAASTTASTSKASKSSSYKFFNPSYIPPNELIDITAKSGGQSGQGGKKNSTFKYVAPVVSIGKNYIVLNTNPKDDSTTMHTSASADLNDQSPKANQIYLKKLNNKRNNKNSHLEVKIQSISNTETTLLLRRSNSSNFKTVTVPNREFSTSKKVVVVEPPTPPTDEIIDEISNLKLSNTPTKPINDHEFISNLFSLGKFNEVLPVFNRIRSNDTIPEIEIYNMVLNSIHLRTNNESIEDRLTHLLNTYSDMLSNNLKPNNETYEIVIQSLFSGSEISFDQLKFQNGFDFFKIGLELIMISHLNKPNLKFKNEEIYLDLISGLINYKIFDVIQPSQVYNNFKSKVSNENYLRFLLSLMKFGGLNQDSEFVHKIYNEVQEITGKKSSQSSNTFIYLSLIESLNFLGEFNSSSKILDQMIINLEDNQFNQELTSTFISNFIKSQAMVNPHLAFESLVKFNSNTWLPDVSIECLVYLASMFNQMNDIEMVNKIWDFTIIRSDFDYQFNSIEKKSAYYPIISIFFNQYIESSLNSNDINQIFKCSREILIKDSIVVSNFSTFSKLIEYLNKCGEFNLSTQLIMNQGVKNPENLNFYLSSIVDSVNASQMPDLINSKIFKSAIEQYRLINDNIYGIMKIINSFVNTNDDQIKLKLKYYSKVLDFEFNDIDNCYVKLPNEIIEFKSKLNSWI